jgi:hypothetical protein
MSRALTTGEISDVTRWNAFLPDYFSVQTAIDVREVTPSHVASLLRLSPVLLFPASAWDYDFELYGVYSFLIGYHGTNARVMTGASGRLLLTEGSVNLGNRSITQLELHADFLHGSIRPGLDVFLPLTLGYAVPIVLGFNIAWTR